MWLKLRTHIVRARAMASNDPAIDNTEEIALSVWNTGLGWTQRVQSFVIKEYSVIVRKS